MSGRQVERNDPLRKIPGDNRQSSTAAVQREMRASFVPPILITHVLPLNPATVRHIYTGRGEQICINGNGGQAADGSERMVAVDSMYGTARSIGEIAASRYVDQDDSVNIIWGSKRYPNKPGSQTEVTRTELEQIDEQTFIRRQYESVSALGAFDGDLTRIELLEEREGFSPESPYPGKKSWKDTEYTRNEDGIWETPQYNLGSAQLLDISGLLGRNLPYVHRIGGSAIISTEHSLNGAGIADQLLALPAPPSDEFQRAEAIGREHPEVIVAMRTQMGRIIDVALGELQNDRVANAAIDGLIDGILRYPSRVGVLGKALSILDPDQRFQLAQALSREGFEHFREWYRRNFATGIDVEAEASQRIITSCLLHFTQFWYEQTQGRFEEPDFQSLAAGVEQIRTGNRQGIRDSLAVRIFEGLQNFAIEVFIEDYLLEQRGRRFSSGK